MIDNKNLINGYSNKPITVFRVVFKKSGKGYTNKSDISKITNPKLRKDVDDADRGVADPTFVNGKKGLGYKNMKKIVTYKPIKGTSPYDFKGYKGLNPVGAYTKAELKKRFQKGGRLHKAFVAAKKGGNPLQVQKIKVPRSKILYNDKQQVVFDKK